MATNATQTGASRTRVESALEKFVASQDFKVLAIKGEWGVGKTYLLKTFLQNRSTAHYYASLFGLATLSQLKSRLLASFENFDDRKTKKMSRRVGQILARHRELLRHIPKVGSYFHVTEEILFSDVRDSVVCLDDIERKLDTLPMVELLGFVSHLAEGRSCKVILVLNEEHLGNGGDREALERYREKIVDAEVRLAPGFEENSSIVFDPTDPGDKTMLNCLSQVEVVNIRLMRRIASVAREFSRKISVWHEAVRNQFLRNLTIIVLARYHDQFIVELSDLPYDLPELRIFEPDSEKQKKARQVYYDLHRIGYSKLPTDTCIIDFVNNLSYDEELLLREGQRLNEQEAANKILSKLRRIWLDYGESFASNERELGAAIEEFLDAHLAVLDLSEFNELKILGDAVGKDLSKYEPYLLEGMIERCPEVFLESLVPFVEDKPRLKDRLEKRRMELAGNRTITSVLLAVAERHAWSETDINFLNERTQEELKEWLIGGHPDLPLMVKWGLGMNVEFSINLKMAIRSLAAVSDLNRMRAERLHRLPIEEIVSDTPLEPGNEQGG